MDSRAGAVWPQQEGEGEGQALGQGNVGAGGNHGRVTGAKTWETAKWEGSICDSSLRGTQSRPCASSVSREPLSTPHIGIQSSLAAY